MAAAAQSAVGHSQHQALAPASVDDSPTCLRAQFAQLACVLHKEGVAPGGGAAEDTELLVGHGSNVPGEVPPGIPLVSRGLGGTLQILFRCWRLWTILMVARRPGSGFCRLFRRTGRESRSRAVRWITGKRRLSRTRRLLFESMKAARPGWASWRRGVFSRAVWDRCADAGSGRVRLWALTGAHPATDIGALQACAPPDSLFQVASQIQLPGGAGRLCGAGGRLFL